MLNTRWILNLELHSVGAYFRRKIKKNRVIVAHRTKWFFENTDENPSKTKTYTSTAVIHFVRLLLISRYVWVPYYSIFCRRQTRTVPYTARCGNCVFGCRSSVSNFHCRIVLIKTPCSIVNSREIHKHERNDGVHKSTLRGKITVSRNVYNSIGTKRDHQTQSCKRLRQCELRIWRRRGLR